MRLIVVICLIVVLAACGLAPKDYSSAKKLEPIDEKLTVASLWVKSTGEVPEYAHAQLLPTFVDNKIYISSINGDVSLIGADSGELLWKTTLDENLTSGPGVGKGMVFVGSHNAMIIALDDNTGAERWRTNVPSEALATPLVVGQSLIVQTIDGNVVAVDTETGKFIWGYSHEIPKLTLRGTATPIINGNQIIAGFSDGKLVSLNVETGEVNWKATVTVPRGRTDLERLADIDGLFQVSSDSVYVSSYQGRVASISLIDGTIQWARKMSSFNGLSVSGGHIFITDTDGQIWSLDARTGATLWRQNSLTGRKISSPVVMNDAVVVADYEGYTHWLALEDGQVIARQSMNKIWDAEFQPEYDEFFEEMDSDDLPRLVTVSPSVINNILYIRDNTGAFAAFQVKSKIN